MRFKVLNEQRRLSTMLLQLRQLQILLQLLWLLPAANAGWQRPQIFLYAGYLNIYEHNNDYVEPNRVNVGDKYTLEIRMDQTDKYDYLIERCTYNAKYHFIDHNSCLIPNQYFVQKWENDAYGYPGVSKRTLVHFYAPEPLDAIECRVKIIQCCACAERACGKDINRTVDQCPQQVVVIHTNKPNAVAMDASDTTEAQPTIPWWLWVLFALLLLLLLCCCLSCLFYWIYSKRKQKPKETASATVITPLETKSEVHSIDDQNSMETTPKKLIPAEPVSVIPPTAFISTKNLPKKPHRHRRPEMVKSRKSRMYYTPSESPSDSAHSSISHSKPALKMIQTVQQQQNDDCTTHGKMQLTRLPGLDPSTRIQKPNTVNSVIAPTTETQRETVVTQQRLITPLESKASQTLATNRIHQHNSPILLQSAVNSGADTGLQHNNSLRPDQVRERGDKVEERYFARNYLDGRTSEEGYDQIQYRYLQHYTESESG